MTTRDVLRWHLTVRDCLHLASMAMAGAVLLVLDGAATGIERWIDKQG